MENKKEKQKNQIHTPKGMHDILSEDYEYYKNIYEKATEIADYYGFNPIQTPHLEKAELFDLSAGETSDIVSKQMYTLKTRGGDKLALRPEGTAPIMRAYLENGMFSLPQPIMLRYSGSFFRHENPQKGRMREFQQFGLEVIGEQKWFAEAAIIKTIILILEELKISPIKLHINSIGDKECLKPYQKELVSYYKKKINNICGDCKRRLKENPMRLLDCKNEKCAEIKKEAPQMIGHLCENCRNHFKEVLEFLEKSDIPYFLDKNLVRGMDYYSKTVFEIFTENDNSETPLAIAAGGRYDYLAKIIGKKDVPAAGGAMGIDRIVQIMKDKNIKLKQEKTPKIFFIQLGPHAKYKSFAIMEMLRKAKMPVSQSISKESLRGQLRIASNLNIPYSLIMGQKEAMENTIILKNMDTMDQEVVPISKLTDYIKKLK